MSKIINQEKNEIRLYLLGQLGEADQERLELRLLTDPAFAEEFDTVVDEITDQYVGNELATEERKHVEQYFLSASERQQKVQFADELIQRASAERGSPRFVAPSAPGLLERLLAFWTKQPFSFRTATTVATLVIAVGLIFVLWPRNQGSGRYEAITLPLATGDRAGGSESRTVRLDPGDAGIRIELTLPEQFRNANSYRVELQDEQQRSRDLRVAERTPQSLIVTIPTDELTRGTYIIQLHANGQRVRGSYLFNVL